MSWPHIGWDHNTGVTKIYAKDSILTARVFNLKEVTKLTPKIDDSTINQT